MKVGNKWYIEILNYSQIPSPALLLLLLPVSIKQTSTRWEMIKHTVIPAIYIELSLHKYRTGTKLVCSFVKTFSRKLPSMLHIFEDISIISYILNSVRSCYMKNTSMHTAHKTSHHSRDTWKEYILLSFFEGNLKLTSKLHKTVTKSLIFPINTLFVIWHLTCSV